MPHITSRRQVESAVIEFAIHSIDEETDTCYICAQTFCVEARCRQAMTHLKCCTQPVCCACVVKMAKQCTCADECDAVIAYCPYCRMISPVMAIDVFLGACTSPCRTCKTRDETENETETETVTPAPVL